MRVLIFGSCVSRDAFEFATDGSVSIVDYYARSSFASAFQPNPVEDRFSAGLASSFQRRQVRRDFNKTFSHAVRTSDFDLLLVDFTDERFQLFELDDGRIVTVSTELRAVNFPGAMRGRLIRPFTAAHFNLWERGWEHFIDLMRREDSLRKVRINRAFWSDRTDSGTELGAAGTPERVSLANRYFTQIYERVSLDSSNFIDYDQSLILSKQTHKWGVAPFHYIDSFYMRTLEAISN